MAGLQKVKESAPKCFLSGSPKRSPVKIPAAHLRQWRRKTLRMLLDSNSSEPTRISGAISDAPSDGSRGLRSRRKLKDVLVSSPPQLDPEQKESAGRVCAMSDTAISTTSGFELRRSFRGSLRPSMTGFRHRLMMRRAWRPVLFTIPE